MISEKTRNYKKKIKYDLRLHSRFSLAVEDLGADDACIGRLECTPAINGMKARYSFPSPVYSFFTISFEKNPG